MILYNPDPTTSPGGNRRPPRLSTVFRPTQKYIFEATTTGRKLSKRSPSSSLSLEHSHSHSRSPPRSSARSKSQSGEDGGEDKGGGESERRGQGSRETRSTSVRGRDRASEHGSEHGIERESYEERYSLGRENDEYVDEDKGERSSRSPHAGTQTFSQRHRQRQSSPKLSSVEQSHLSQSTDDEFARIHTNQSSFKMHEPDSSFDIESGTATSYLGLRRPSTTNNFEDITPMPVLHPQGLPQERGYYHGHGEEHGPAQRPTKSSDDPRANEYPNTLNSSSHEADSLARDGDSQPPIKDSRWSKIGRILKRHARFVGPGLVSSIAYFDPGNWTVDLQAGSSFGYKLLFVVLLASLGAVVLQTLALRLGCVTGTSLAKQVRLRSRYVCEHHPRIAPYKWRKRSIVWAVWGLYGLSEVAIIATDLAELLGSAIALNLIFPKLPLWAGVLITVTDVLVVLAFFQQPAKGRRGMMLFEVLLTFLVGTIFVSFLILIAKAHPAWGQVFFGFVPSKTVFAPSALYTSVGIIGATVMPHALYLGSGLGSIDRLEDEHRRTHVGLFARIGSILGFDSSLGRSLSKVEKKSSNISQTPASEPPVSPRVSAAAPFSIIRNFGRRPREQSPEQFELDAPRGDTTAVVAKEDEAVVADTSTKGPLMGRVESVRIHLRHATVDLIFSLMGVALVINAAILIVASATFYYSSNSEVQSQAQSADLFAAYALIRKQIGEAAAFIFALALLCCGLSASITATLAGQIVSEDFINWRTNPFYRRLITRLISAVPSAAVAAVVGRSGMNEMLVASQVILSIILPFAIIPLLWLTALKDVMTVEEDEESSTQSHTQAGPATTVIESSIIAPANNSSQETILAVETTPREIEPVENISKTQVVKLGDGSGLPTSTLPTLVTESSVVTEKVAVFTAGKWILGAGYLILAVVVLANAYVLVELMLGND